MLTIITERIRLSEVLIMSSFQTNWSSFESLFMLGSNLGDPQNGYIYYSVLCFLFISHSSAFKLMWTAVVSEWLNLVLKWLFNDDRPYWWSQQIKHELMRDNRSHYSDLFATDDDYAKTLNGLDLKQFSVTCETGPGLPSGHVMCSTAVWFCLILEAIGHKTIGSRNHKLLVRTVFIALVFMVTLGRIYISAHFPDQCFFGLVAGVVVALIVDKTVHIQRISFGRHLLLALSLVVVSYALYEFMGLYFAYDADWSLALAKRYCFDIKHVRPDTTPLNVVWRTSGALIGTGIAFKLLLNGINRSAYVSLAKTKANGNVRFVNAFVSTVSVIIYVNYTKPEPSFERLYTFYVMSFLQFLFIPIVGLVSILCVDRIMRVYMKGVYSHSKRF